jgi:hypothetical protein
VSVESVCYANELARAEAWTNEHYGEPTAAESHGACRHAAACDATACQVARMLGATLETGELPAILGCDECCEWEG